jgi:hypothetical protein
VVDEVVNVRDESDGRLNFPSTAYVSALDIAQDSDFHTPGFNPHQGVTMSTHHRAASTAATAALVVAASAALAAPADAAPPYLSMSSSIRMAVSDSRRSPGGNFLEQVVYFEGVVSMSQAAAQDTINHHDDIFALRYWGDDTNDDDLLFGPVTADTFAAPDGLHFQRATALTHAQLDEDNGTLENIGDAGYDEIYVGARFLDRNGKTISKVESNRLTGDF